MISAPIAHVGGIPIEETLVSLGPALLAGLGVAWANLRSRLGRVRSRTRRCSTRHGAQGDAGELVATVGSEALQ
jgi:hypothetical protein